MTDLTNDKTRADYLEGEYRWMVEAVEKLAREYPTIMKLRHMAKLGRVALTELEPERDASELVVKAALLRDGNVTSLAAHRTARRIPITTNTDGPCDVA